MCLTIENAPDYVMEQVQDIFKDCEIIVNKSHVCGLTIVVNILGFEAPSTFKLLYHCFSEPQTLYKCLRVYSSTIELVDAVFDFQGNDELEGFVKWLATRGDYES